MKKMLLILVSSLLIVCMAGSAMANPCRVSIDTPKHLSDGTPYFDISTTEATGTITVDRYLVPDDRTLSIITNDESIMATLDGTNWATKGNMKSITYSIPGALDPVENIVKYNNVPVVKTFTVTVKHAPGTPLKPGTVTVFDNEGTVYTSADVAQDSASVSVGANIPEFPTVALPIAAILGLVFVFGRKKEGL